MGYFLPSFFQKRLLKYALSRVGLVDTEALDLDNLGIRWGQRSTVELRDVGLKTEKLATLLNLPSSCELLGARIQLLRITIPADIYSSGVICEASGIDVHIRFSSDESSLGKHGKERGTKSASAAVPTATDLAQSFLESEPKEERDELRAAISSQSQVLQHDPLAYGDEEEDELGLGSETTSLPSFVAGFVRGVVDRLQLSIKNVSVRVDMELKQDGMSKRQPEDKPDLVAGLLTVREIDVYGISENTAKPEEGIPSRNGKRLISIVDINVGLISDPMVFSNYSRFAAPPSPTTTRSKESQPSSRAPSPSHPLLDHSDPEPLSMTQSTIFEPPQDLYRSNVTGHDLEASTFSHGRFSDADSEGSHHGGYIEDSQVFGDDPFQDNPGYLDSVIDNQFDDFDDGQPPFIQQSENELAQSGRSDSSPNPERMSLSYDAEHYSQASLRPESLHVRHLYDSHQSQTGSEPHEAVQPVHNVNVYDDNEYNERSHISAAPQPSYTPSPTSERGSTGLQDAVPNADLMESKYFSHDEAQSLYMSAISQEPNRQEPSESFMPNMPGAWESYNSAGDQNSVSDYHSVNIESDDTPKITAPSQEYFVDQTLDHQEQTFVHRDRASTPSSPDIYRINETNKPIFSLDRILVWVPSTFSPLEEEVPSYPSPTPPRQRADSDLIDSTVSFRDSAVEDSLVASKTYASTRFERRSSESPGFGRDAQTPEPYQTSFSISPHEIAVEMFSVSVHFDIATGWLLTKIGQKVLHALSLAGKAPSEKQLPNDRPPPTPPLHLVIHDISVKFLEHVTGYAHSSGDSGSPLPPSYSMEDVILRVTASDLNGRISSQNTTMKLKLGVWRFAFGFASEDLISFNETLKMRESTRDTAASSGDISIALIKSPNLAKVDISTLPLHVNLNVQRLEEVLGWMGGLSTILELGSSISSVSTVKGGQPPPKKRGVHFETPALAPEKVNSDSPLWKVNARIGGISLDVIGETHCLQLTTTAVKIVSRFEGIGIQIDKAKLLGPLLLDDSADSPAKITLNNIRVEFLFAPKEPDLDRLLKLITPSKDKYEEEDDIMLETLLRQRRQGSVLRVTVAGVKAVISDISGLEPLSSLGVELSRLSNVTKYLPEDDRPGILTLVLLRELDGHVHIGGDVGDININLTDAEVAIITMPSLTAAQVGTITVKRNDDEVLVGEALWPPSKFEAALNSRPPVLMARFIPDEMDPTYRIKLHNLLVEYTIPSVTAFLGLGNDKTSGDLASDMANSIANLAEHSMPSPMSGSPRSDKSKSPAKPLKLSVVFRDCVVGLNPRNSPAKGLAVLTNAKFVGSMDGEESAEASLDIRKASLMIIDDVSNNGNAGNLHQRDSAVSQSSQSQAYIDNGYVPVSSISSATAGVKLARLGEGGTKSLDVELRDDLLILETCADSTQTLISIINGLQPPAPPNINVKYRTEVMPIQDMFASFTGDAFAADSLPDSDHDDLTTISEEPYKENELNDEIEYVSDFYPVKRDFAVAGESMEASSHELLDSFHSQYSVSSSIGELDFQDDHFAKQSAVGGTAHRWDSTQNTYGLSNDTKLQRSPLRVRVRDVHVIWNLFDGYDWQRTRDTISKAVKDVETKATERRARGSRVSPSAEDEEESVIGDFLFNSIYIGIPANKDPRELHREINNDIDDLTSETGSYATSTTITGASSRQGRATSKREKKLRLHRSKHHKMTFELKGVCADLVLFPPDSEETQSSLDVRIKDLEIYDHVPTSTWKKFATYMHEAGEKESGTSMVHLEILTVKPIPELAASEIVLKATVLPLRLHVDQDALDFMSRFFEFRDESAEENSKPGDVPFLQRVEINAVQVKLDFKPKRVDYAGLRSGRTTEFMNFFVLDGADMVLRHVIIYGISGFDRMGQTLNDIWMPDVKQNQLPGVLAGLAPIRSLVNVGSGVRDLVVVPMREYKKDGRIVRSFQKGALAFAKTTSNELVKLGAKLAIGTQTVLQGAEDLLTTPSALPEDDNADEDEAKKISLYADQPVGVVQGLRGAFSGLERDLLLARDAIVAVPGEVVESGSAKAAAKAVWKRAPTVILRPAIGVSKAVGQTLLGAGNTLDPSNRRKMEDKYKRH